MKVFCIEILVGLASPLSFFFSFDPSITSPFFGLLPALLALAVKLKPFPVLLGDPKVPPSLDGEPAWFYDFVIFMVLAFLTPGESLPASLWIALATPVSPDSPPMQSKH
jgi:hypothetical protein